MRIEFIEKVREHRKTKLEEVAGSHQIKTGDGLPQEFSGIVSFGAKSPQNAPVSPARKQTKNSQGESSPSQN